MLYLYGGLGWWFGSLGNQSYVRNRLKKEFVVEPPRNLHQSECMIKPTSADRGTTSTCWFYLALWLMQVP